MTPEAQRIAIAEACGWEPCPARKGVWLPAERPGFLAAKSEHLPDYLNSLDAMHEAEKVLMARGLWYKYCDALHRLGDGVDRTAFMHAAATQRAEAFLRTLSLWTEAQP